MFLLAIGIDLVRAQFAMDPDPAQLPLSGLQPPHPAAELKLPLAGGKRPPFRWLSTSVSPCGCPRVRKQRILACCVGFMASALVTEL